MCNLEAYQIPNISSPSNLNRRASGATKLSISVYMGKVLADINSVISTPDHTELNFNGTLTKGINRLHYIKKIVTFPNEDVMHDCVFLSRHIRTWSESIV